MGIVFRQPSVETAIPKESTAQLNPQYHHIGNVSIEGKYPTTP